MAWRRFLSPCGVTRAVAAWRQKTSPCHPELIFLETRLDHVGGNVLDVQPLDGVADDLGQFLGADIGLDRRLNRIIVEIGDVYVLDLLESFERLLDGHVLLEGNVGYFQFYLAPAWCKRVPPECQNLEL